MKNVSWEKAIIVWWSFAWRSTLVGLVWVFAVGSVFGILIPPQADPNTTVWVIAFATWSGLIVVSVWAIRAALQKHLEGIATHTSMGAVQ